MRAELESLLERDLLGQSDGPVAGQGHTIDEALANLAEAVELYLEEVDDAEAHPTATPLVTSFQVPGAA